MDERSDAPTPSELPAAPDEGDRTSQEPDDGPSPRPQSPASRGIRGGLFVALAAALLVLAANDSWLLPSLDQDGVAWLYAATALTEGQDATVPVAAWNAPDSVSGLGERGRVVPEAMAMLMRRGTRVHVAGLWFLAGSMVLLTLLAAWVAGGASGVEGGLLAGGLLLFSPLAVEAATALRPEALAAALVALQLGLMAYRPRWHPAHGAAAALAWAVHPAAAGAVAAAALWPFLPDAPPLGPGLGDRAAGRSLGRRGMEAGSALLPALALLLLGPAVRGLPSLPAVLGDGPATAPLAQLVDWAGAGLPGMAGTALGILVLAGAGTLVLLEAVTTPPVDPGISWKDPRAPDLVAIRARAAGWLLALALGLGVVTAGPGAELERSGLLVAVPVAVLAAAAVVRWIGRAPGRQGWFLSGMVGAWLLVSAWTGLARSREIRDEGRGLTTASWLESETVRWLDNRLPGGFEIYASSPYLVLIQTTLSARTLPPEGASLEAFGNHVARRPGVVVLTGADTVRAPAFRDALGLVPVVQGDEGWILAPVVRPAGEEGGAEEGSG